MKFKITPWSVLIIAVLGLLTLIGLLMFLGNVFAHFLHSLGMVGALVLLSVLVLFAFVYDQIAKKKHNKDNTQFLGIARYLTAKNADEFDTFYNQYFRRKKDFIAQNLMLLKEYDNFDLDNLKPVELLYIFLSSKKLIGLIDWTGEENEYEIEDFLAKIISPPKWQNVQKFRNNTDNKKLKGDKFIRMLFKATDKDLQTINQRLVFLDMEWDAYVYTCINKKDFEAVMKSQFFYGVDKLR